METAAKNGATPCSRHGEARAPIGALPPAVDVLVVGCGPVGATIANLLARHGVNVMVVDRSTEVFMAPRAIALDNEALRILQLAGVAESDFETIAIPYVRMRSPMLGLFGRVNSLGSLDGHPKLVTFYQPDLERCLRARLETYDCAHIALGVELKSFTEERDHVLASLDLGQGRTHVVRARYLVGADGASSLVRQLIGQEFKGKTFAEDWLIVDARHVPRPIDHIEFICDHRRPIPHMVAPGGRERWEFMLRPGERREDMESETRIRELLSPWGKVEDMIIERKAVYRFHARAVDAFSKGRVFLAGDAAHITPPFVGQGLVAGLRDAANLCWKLAWVVQGRADPGILDTYDEERRPHAKAMINLAKFMGKLVMPRSGVVALLTHGLMRLSRLVPRLRAQFEELQIKPKNAFRQGTVRQGPLVDEACSWRCHRARLGERFGWHHASERRRARAGPHADRVWRGCGGCARARDGRSVCACRRVRCPDCPSGATAASCPARQLGRPRRRISSRAGARRVGCRSAARQDDRPRRSGHRCKPYRARESCLAG